MELHPVAGPAGTEPCLSEYIFTFSSFLLSQHFQEIERILAQPDVSKYAAVRVNFLDLACFHSDLAALILARPTTFLPILDEALRDAQTRLLTERESSHASETQEQRLSFKPLVHVRISNLPQCAEVTKPTISGLRSADMGRLIVLSGTVTRTGSVMVREKEREYECLKCGYQFRAQATPVSKSVVFELPLRCPSGNELQDSETSEATSTTRGRPWKRFKRCNAPCSGTRFAPVTRSNGDAGTCACGDYQEIRLQESVQHLGMGSIPRSILVVLTDELAGSCKAGDEITVTGILQRRWLRPLVPGTRCDMDVILEANYVQINNERKAIVDISPDLLDAFGHFWRLAKRDGVILRARDRIIRAVCPQTYGMFIVKLAVLLSLIGGVPQEDSSGARVRGESHLLLVGDPGTAKSRLLRYAALLSPRAVLTTGIGTSGAGLTVTAVREPATGEWALEAGALVLADGGLCCIDEFDSIREHDRAAIHEAMEQQTVSVAKAGLVCRLNTRATVFAATNPKATKASLQHLRKSGETGNSLSIALGVASPLLSRFDVILILTDKQDDEWDERVADFVLNDYAEKKSPFRRPPDDVFDNPIPSLDWSLEQLRQYLHHVRGTFRPTLSPASECVLGAYYALRRTNSERSAARTTVRLLESLVRLTQAHARLMYRKRAVVQDAIFAIAVVDPDFVEHFLTGGGDPRQSDFSSDPDNAYLDYAKLVLQKLGIESKVHMEEGLPIHSGLDLNPETSWQPSRNETVLEEPVLQPARPEEHPQPDSEAAAPAVEPLWQPSATETLSENDQQGGEKTFVERALDDFDFDAIESRFLTDASLGSWAASLGPS